MTTVIETSVGLDRTFLAILSKSYYEDTADTCKEGKDQELRIVLRLPATVAPIQVAVLPLSKKLNEAAEKLYFDLNRHFRCEFDVTGSIGKRYRRQDEIGTPFCITYAIESESDNADTVRERDSKQPERVNLSTLRDYLEDKIGF